MSEDIELLRLTAGGDQESFRRLIALHKASVYNTIYSMTGGAASADDIAQEVFIKVYRCAATFREESSFSTWLYRITINHCLDALRKKRTTFSLDETADGEGLRGLADCLEEPCGIERELLRRETAEIVRAALKYLPENYRAAIILKEFEGLSYAEIAQILNISVDKVKVWLFRARQALRERLKRSDVTQGGGTA